jgi:hypothetical protein
VLESYGCEAGRRLVRLQLPAGPAPGRARRALHPALPPRLGPPRRREEGHRVQGRRSRPACAALIRDLKQRGMLDDTLVVWGGEFGRTPMSQGGDGRDHHIKGFSSGWPAAASSPASPTARPTSSATPRWRPVAVHDLHATMLHLLGIDHKRLT